MEAAQSLAELRRTAAGKIAQEKGTAATLDEVSEVWEELSALPQPEQMPDGVQLLVGVFSTRLLIHEKAVRALIVRTWMRRRGVCWLQCGQRPGCSVYVAFVLGLAKGPEEGSLQELVLDVREGMNRGKSYAFFQEAPRRFPWLTHLAKSDLDTFVWPSGLAWGLQAWRRLEAPHASCYEFGGRPMTSGCRRPECSVPERCNLRDGFGNVPNASFLDPDCHLAFHGALYLMDARLALAATAPGAPWSLGTKAGAEDRLTSHYVREAVRRGGGCLSAWTVKEGFRHFAKAGVTKQHKGSRRGFKH